MGGCFCLILSLQLFIYSLEKTWTVFFFFERDCTLLFSNSAFIGLKVRKNACVGESQNDGKEKSGSAEQLSIASLALSFLDLICLYIDHPSLSFHGNAAVSGTGQCEVIP